MQNNAMDELARLLRSHIEHVVARSELEMDQAAICATITWALTEWDLSKSVYEDADFPIERARAASALFATRVAMEWLADARVAAEQPRVRN